LDKLLVIGSTGLIGSKLAAMATKYGFEAYNTWHITESLLPNSRRLDVGDREATLRLVKDIQPRVIVNTAALTNVDYCETHTVEAETVNVGGARSLAEAARITSSRLIQVSTDTVFDGSSGHYVESDRPKPLNHYSRTKLDAEKIVSELPNYAIARPSVVYGWHQAVKNEPSGPTKAMNFAMFVLDKLNNSQTLRAVRDQYSSPTFANNLAEAVLRLANCNENGVFHTSGRSCLSRYEFALKLGQVFGCPTDLIRPVFSSDFPQAAARPKNCCLRVEKAERTLGMRFLTAEEGIREMKKEATSRFGPTIKS
jgi:dTDP-4-dehydrorhamnose reductase